MLFTKGLIKLFVVNLRLLNCLGSFLYHIDPITYKLKFNNSRSFKHELFSKCGTTLIIYIIMSVQLISFRGIFSNVEFYEGIFIIALPFGYLVTMYVYYSRSIQVLNLFNSLVELEQQLIRGKSIQCKINRNLKNICLSFLFSQTVSYKHIHLNAVTYWF